jgi:hypothetical protein
MTNFTISPYTLESVANQSSISVKVKGFWSGGTIHMYPRMGYGDTPELTIDISTSSGGRDPKEVATDVEAYGYYAEALKAVTELAAELLSKKTEIEAIYKGVREEYARQAKEERAKRQAEFDADAPFTEAEANSFINDLTGPAAATVYTRGRRDPVAIINSGYTRASYRINGRSVTRKELMAQLMTNFCK